MNSLGCNTYNIELNHKKIQQNQRKEYEKRSKEATWKREQTKDSKKIKREMIKQKMSKKKS